MLMLDMLNIMLVVSEEGMVEEMIFVLLVFLQLVIFFEKFLCLKNVVIVDFLCWWEVLCSCFKDVCVLLEFMEEVMCYQ